ncbi:MAG: hypothetical protein HYZ71_07875 [Deltaproteobacteria bacterium]|nr:hypothetical protein [Deltaproteobacteria bacterium]
MIHHREDGFVPIFVALGIVSLLALLSLSMSLSSHLSLKRRAQNINRTEAFYINEIFAWHAQSRQADSLIISSSQIFDNTPFTDQHSGTYSTTPGEPIPVGITKLSAPAGTLQRRYNEKSNLAVDSERGLCGQSRFNDKKGYLLCLKSTPLASRPSVILTWSSQNILTGNNFHLWMLGIGRDGKLTNSFGNQGYIRHLTPDQSDPYSTGTMINGSRIVGFFPNLPCIVGGVCPLVDVLVMNTSGGTRFFSARNGQVLWPPHGLIPQGGQGLSIAPPLIAAQDYLLFPNSIAGTQSSPEFDIAWTAMGSGNVRPECGGMDCGRIEAPATNEYMLAWRLKADSLRIASVKDSRTLSIAQFKVGTAQNPLSHLDASYGNAGVTETLVGPIDSYDIITQIRFEPDDRVLVVVVNSQQMDWRFCLYDNGTLVGSCQNMISNEQFVRGDFLWLSPEGQVHAIGQRPGPNPSLYILRMNSSGVPDSSFGNAGVATPAFPPILQNAASNGPLGNMQVNRDSQGNYYFGFQSTEGYSAPNPQSVHYRLFKVTPYGSLDSAFGEAGGFEWRGTQAPTTENVLSSYSYLFAITPLD